LRALLWEKGKSEYREYKRGSHPFTNPARCHECAGQGWRGRPLPGQVQRGHFVRDLSDSERIFHAMVAFYKRWNSILISKNRCL
jgi:hypothetical protein